jgi:hypothetical protein
MLQLFLVLTMASFATSPVLLDSIFVLPPLALVFCSRIHVVVALYLSPALLNNTGPRVCKMASAAVLMSSLRRFSGMEGGLQLTNDKDRACGQRV